MNKLHLMAATAMSALLMTTACSNDNLGGQTTVCFNIQTPMLESRSELGNGETAQTLQWAVYDENMVLIPEMIGSKPIQKSTTVEMKLAAGDTYNLIFWADNDNAPYTIKWESGEMIVDYTKTKANDETLDAFWNTVPELKVVATTDINVDLYRPFAQVNVLTADKADAQIVGLNIDSTRIEIPLHNTLNLWNGKVYTTNADGTTSNQVQNYVWDYAKPVAAPNDTMHIFGKPYDLLVTNYALVWQDATPVEVTLKYKEGQKEYNRTFSNILVQRNYKTNIYGDVLTKGYTFNVQIMQNFKNQQHYYDSNTGTSKTE